MTNKCPTCFEPLISDSKNYIVTTPCGHLFHMNCVQGWLDTGNQTCPQCRGVISKDKLLRIYLPPIESDVPKSPPETPSSNSVAFAKETDSVFINSHSNSARTDPGTTRTINEAVIRSNQEKTDCDGCYCCLFVFVLCFVGCLVAGIMNYEKEKNWLNEKNSVSGKVLVEN